MRPTDPSPASPYAGRVTVALALAAGLCVGPLGAPASAESVTVSDPRDPGSAGLDIVSAHFTNTGPDLGGTVTLHRLGKRGTVTITIAMPAGTLELAARRTTDGTLRKRVRFVATSGETLRVRCPVGATWASQAGLVRMGISVRCLRQDVRLPDRLGGTTFTATTATNREQDRTRSVRVRRTKS